MVNHCGRECKNYLNLKIDIKRSLHFRPDWLSRTVTIAVVLLQSWYAPADNTGTMTTAGTSPHTANTGSPQLCQVISQVLNRATGGL